jgi:hypothetical protein
MKDIKEMKVSICSFELLAYFHSMMKRKPNTMMKNNRKYVPEFTIPSFINPKNMLPAIIVISSKVSPILCSKLTGLYIPFVCFMLYFFLAFLSMMMFAIKTIRPKTVVNNHSVIRNPSRLLYCAFNQFTRYSIDKRKGTVQLWKNRNICKRII